MVSKATENSGVPLFEQALSRTNEAIAGQEVATRELGGSTEFCDQAASRQTQGPKAGCDEKTAARDGKGRKPPPSLKFPSRGVTARNLLEKLKQQNFKCAISGRELTVDNVAADHILAESLGGGHELSNLHLVTREINRMKGTMTQEAFVSACIDVAKTNGYQITKS